MNDRELGEFLSQFQTEEDCIEYIFKVKWPSGFSCPCCSHPQSYTISTRRLPLYECMKCRYQTSLTVDTVMQGSKTELRKWLTALFLMSRPSSGISALQLSKKINVTYKTAWLMLHKIRDAMSQADAKVKLCGFVEVNDVWYGHTRHSSLRRHPREYALLIGATMKDSTTPTYVKMKRVPERNLVDRRIIRVGGYDFIQKHAETDVSNVEFVVGRGISSKYKKFYPLFRQMNRWIRTTFHGVSGFHLHAYLNEFCYRVNVKLKNENIFDQLTHLCVNSRFISYAALIS